MYPEWASTPQGRRERAFYMGDGMNNLNKIAGAGLCAALLAACGAAVNPVVPAAKTLLAPLKTTSAESVL
jgi:hypothetical protein